MLPESLKFHGPDTPRNAGELLRPFAYGLLNSVRYPSYHICVHFHDVLARLHAYQLHLSSPFEVWFNG